MKIPKKIKFAGHTWNVVITKNQNKAHEGSFNWKTKEIKINDRYEEAELIFLHEIIEAILLDNYARYYGNEGNQEYFFAFNHTRFAKIIKDIFQVCKDNKII